MRTERITTTALRAMKRRGQKIAMLTAYDYPTAQLIDRAGIPVLLVGDSVGTAVLGHETTVPVTVDDIVHHTKAVMRAVEHALVVADMPFMTYRIDQSETMRTAMRLMQEGGAHAVKLEGAGSAVDAVAKLVESGIPVMAHIGLTPQSVYQFGGYRVQGKRPQGAARILEEAKALEEAGAFAIVLELVAPDAAEAVTKQLSIPTIGIGSGPHCDGQVQVLHDLLGLTIEAAPRHAKQYADLATAVDQAVRRFASDVQAGVFLADDASPPPSDLEQA